jgi:hypothetical protein
MPAGCECSLGQVKVFDETLNYKPDVAIKRIK